MIHLVDQRTANRLLPYAEKSFEHIRDVPQPNSIEGRLLLRANPDSTDVWVCFSVARDRRPPGKMNRFKDWASPLGMPALPPYPHGSEVRRDKFWPIEPTDWQPYSDGWIAQQLWNLDFRCQLAYVHTVGKDWWKLPPHLLLVQAHYGADHGGSNRARLFYVRRGSPESSFAFPPQCPAKVKTTMSPAPKDQPILMASRPGQEGIFEQRSHIIKRIWANGHQ